MKRGTGPLLIVRKVEDRLADKGKGQQREEIPLPVPCVREALGEQEDIERKSEVAQHIKHAVDALHGAEPCGRVLRDERANISDEEGITNALFRRVLAKLILVGPAIGGFQAYVTSEVLIGAGLSSSAAFETHIGTILSYMYNGGEVNPIEIAKIGLYAENVYFGKPCGLMDQMACSVGGLIHIDFADPENPIVKQLKFDLNTYGYSICITDTKGTHTDLTPDYAAIPQEMKKAAECLGKNFLGEVSKEEIINNITQIRDYAGDRAALRALHIV